MRYKDYECAKCGASLKHPEPMKGRRYYQHPFNGCDRAGGWSAGEIATVRAGNDDSIIRKAQEVEHHDQ